MSSSKKTNSNSNSKNKIISSSKKPTKSSIYSKIKYIVYILTYTITTIITTLAFKHFYSNNFKIFASLVISTLPISYMYNKHMKTPTKVDSQKNIIKLPLSTFKFYVKKLVKILKPAISVMSSSLKLLAFLLLADAIFELSKQYKESKKGIVEFVGDLFTSNKIVDKAELDKINYNDFNKYYEDFYVNFFNENIYNIINEKFPNINIRDEYEVNRILRENHKLLNNIMTELFRKKYQEANKLRDAYVKYTKIMKEI